MGHFSKYIPQDSVRIDLQFISDDPDVSGTAFLRPDGKRVIVILNRFKKDNYTLFIRWVVIFFFLIATGRMSKGLLYLTMLTEEPLTSIAMLIR